MAKQPSNKSESQVAGKQVTVQLPFSADLPLGVYSNWVGVGNTEFDVSLDFAQISLPSSEAELASLGDRPVMPVRPVTRVLIPINLLPKLIEALQLRQNLIAEERSAHEEGK